MDNSAGGDIDEVARESTAVAVNWTGLGIGLGILGGCMIFGAVFAVYCFYKKRSTIKNQDSTYYGYHKSLDRKGNISILGDPDDEVKKPCKQDIGNTGTVVWMDSHMNVVLSSDSVERESRYESFSMDQPQTRKYNIERDVLTRKSCYSTAPSIHSLDLVRRNIEPSSNDSLCNLLDTIGTPVSSNLSSQSGNTKIHSLVRQNNSHISAEMEVMKSDESCSSVETNFLQLSSRQEKRLPSSTIQKLESSITRILVTDSYADLSFSRMLADEKEINAADSSADPSVDQPAFVHVSLEDTPQSGVTEEPKSVSPTQNPQAPAKAKRSHAVFISNLDDEKDEAAEPSVAVCFEEADYEPLEAASDKDKLLKDASPSSNSKRITSGVRLFRDLAGRSVDDAGRSQAAVTEVCASPAVTKPDSAAKLGSPSHHRRSQTIANAAAGKDFELQEPQVSKSSCDTRSKATTPTPIGQAKHLPGGLELPDGSSLLSSTPAKRNDSIGEPELVKSLNYEPVYDAWDGTPVKTGRKRMYQPARSSPIAGFSDTPSRLPPPKPSRMICREPARNFNARLEAAVEKQADLSPEKPAKKSAQKPDDLSAEKQADQSAEKPTNQSAVQPADQSAEKPAIISVDQTADTPTGTIARRAPKLNIQIDSCSNLLQWDDKYEELKTEERALKLVVTPVTKKPIDDPRRPWTPLQINETPRLSHALDTGEEEANSSANSSHDATKTSKASSVSTKNNSSLQWDESCDGLEISCDGLGVRGVVEAGRPAVLEASRVGLDYSVTDFDLSPETGSILAPSDTRSSMFYSSSPVFGQLEPSVNKTGSVLNGSSRRAGDRLEPPATTGAASGGSSFSGSTAEERSRLNTDGYCTASEEPL